MILFIDMTHVDFPAKHPETYRNVNHRRMLAKYAFEGLSGSSCLIMRYTQFSKWKRGELSISGIKQLIFSGFNTVFDKYPKDILEDIMDWMRAPRLPTFTICGSFQLMAHAHGSTIAPMGPLPSDEDTHADPVVPNDMKAELGFQSVTVHHPSKLFDREKPELKVFQHHYWEVKDVPPGFRHTASSPICHIQALEHSTLPISGVQFHPEDFNDEYSDGKLLLLNVFKKR